jgi:nucleotide-binding universal stress UspA family protein
MTLIRVIQPTPSAMPNRADLYAIMAERPVEDSALSAQSYLDEAAESIRREHPTIDVRTDLRIADSAAPAIVQESCAGDGALVALATRGRGASRLIIGSVADKVIRAAGDGVLVIRSVGSAS